MTPHDFIFNQIYKGAKAAKCTERAAHDAATIGLDKYKKKQL